MKLYSVCNIEKPEIDFYKNGAGVPINPCKACRLECCRISRSKDRERMRTSGSREEIITKIFAEYVGGSSYEPCELDNKKFIFAMSF